jgi:uracil phosphoribosyltransferase
MPVTIVDHPLVADRITQLRDERTTPADFRRLANEVATFLAYEALRDVPTDDVAVRTPLEVDAPGRRLRHPLPFLVPVLRAGLGLLDGVLAAMPGAEVGLAGLRRDEVTFRPDWYCSVIPGDLAGRGAFVLDPMLATGGSLAAVGDVLTERGAASITALCLLASPEGIDRITTHSPATRVVTAAVDERLDERRFIVPGLGDAGDRLFGVR